MVACAAIVETGVTPVWKRAARSVFFNIGGLRILMYHRFPDRSGLEWQCRHLREHYHVISLSEAVCALTSRQPLPPHAVAITIDDGHRDFHQIAWPVFTAYGIPVTVYLVTGFLDGELWLWTDQVRYAFSKTAFIYGLGVLPNGQPAPVNPGFLQLRTANGKYNPATTAQQVTPLQAQLGVKPTF
jgi:Polysaccharide deacetylase